MKRILAFCVMLASIAVLPAEAAKKPKSTGTIGDLEGKEIQVAPEHDKGVRPEQAAEEYRRFLELNAGDPKLRAEAMRRLGDLNVESDEAARGDLAATLTPAQLQGAVKLYESLISTFPQYPRNDAVMYQLSRAYEALQQPDRALAVLDRLVSQYPTSHWYAEAQFRRGEILFSNRRYGDAERAYNAVIDKGVTTGFYDQAIYKTGWAYFKEAKTDESVTSFLKVLDRLLVANGKLRARDALTRPERELSEDAFRALAIQVADVDGAETLNAMLAKRGDPVYTHLLYEGLGNLYLEKERYQDAAGAFAAYAKRRPDDRFAPSLQVRAIEAYQKGGFASKVLEGKQAFVENYAFGAPFWSQRKPEDAPEVVTQLKANLKDLAQYHHAQAQKTKKAEDYAAATRWYRQMLESFPQDAEAPGTRFLLAELLFDSGHFIDATQEYEHTAYEYPPHARSGEAGYAALVAYQKHEPSLNGEAKVKWHRQLIESELMFAHSFPDHANAAAVLTKADEDLFALNEYDRVIEISQQVLARKPPVDAKRERVATTLLAHSLFEKQRYGEAEATYLRAQNLMPANDPERPAIVERVAASIYHQAEAKQASGDANAAVTDYLRVVSLAPTSKVRANAEFDAATVLVNQGQWAQAIPVLEQFRSAHPNHELNPDVTRKLAVAYQETGKKAEAAQEFERIAARREETVDVRRAAQWQAAQLYNQAGATPRAAAAYTTYVAQFPQPFDPAMDARQHLAEMTAAAHDSAGHARWLQEIIAADKSAGSARTDRSKYLAAKATLENVDSVAAEFKSVKLTAPLNKSLKTKRAAMEKALGMYSHALDYGVAEVTTAATYGMAELYRQLAADLLASERPKGLDAEAREQYDVLLEEQAFPFEEKAIQLHQANAKRASEGVYDKSVQQSFEVLAKLMPARYAKAEVGETYVPELR